MNIILDKELSWRGALFCRDFSKNKGIFADTLTALTSLTTRRAKTASR